jgi:ElaB/YqjD/DUF883 family membrane-anchored ribosome-binding protein
MTNATTNKARSTTNGDGGRLEAFKGKLVDVKDKVVKTGDATIDQTKAFVIARPLTALAIAFGVGYLGMRVLRAVR